MNKKLLVGIGAALVVVILSILLTQKIRYSTDINEKGEILSPSADLNTNKWVTIDLGQFTIKHPPQEEGCGHDSEVFFICVVRKEDPDLHLTQLYYDPTGDIPFAACGKNFEDCVVQQKEGVKVFSEKRFLVKGLRVAQLELEGERLGNGKKKILLIDLGKDKGAFWLVQYNLVSAVNKVVEGIINSIEVK